MTPPTRQLESTLKLNGGSMKRLILIAAAGTVVLGLSSGGIVSAAPKTYANCTQLNRDYSGGVAIDDATSRKYYEAGWHYPAVGRALYLANKKLDRDKDGLVCERWNKRNGATPVEPGATPEASSSPSPSPTEQIVVLPTGNTFLDVLLKGLVDTKKVNQAEVTYIWVVLNTFKSNPLTFCVAYSRPAQKEELLNAALTDEQLTKSSIDPSRKDAIRGYLTTFIPIICSR